MYEKLLKIYLKRTLSNLSHKVRFMLIEFKLSFRTFILKWLVNYLRFLRSQKYIKKIYFTH